MGIDRWLMNIDKHSLLVGFFFFRQTGDFWPRHLWIFSFVNPYYLFRVRFIIIFSFCYQSQFIIVIRHKMIQFLFPLTKMTLLSTNTKKKSPKMVMLSNAFSLIYVVESTNVENLSNSIVPYCKCNWTFSKQNGTIESVSNWRRHVLTWLKNEHAMNLSWMFSFSVSYFRFISRIKWKLWLLSISEQKIDSFVTIKYFKSRITY